MTTNNTRTVVLGAWLQERKVDRLGIMQNQEAAREGLSSVTLGEEGSGAEGAACI